MEDFSVLFIGSHSINESRELILKKSLEESVGRPKFSAVWNYFEIDVDFGKTLCSLATCNFCRKVKSLVSKSLIFTGCIQIYTPTWCTKRKISWMPNPRIDLKGWQERVKEKTTIRPRMEQN